MTKARKFKGPIKASELMKILANDPEYHRIKAEKKAERERHWAALDEAARPIVEDLHKAGVDAKSLWVIDDHPDRYVDAIPVLLAHLGRPYPEQVKESLVRGLAMPQAAFAWDRLLAEFKDPANFDMPDYRFALAVALGEIAKAEGREQEILELLRDRSLGGGRLGLLEPIAFAKDKSLRKHLAEFADDPDIGEHVRWQLKHPHRRRR